MAHSDGGSMAEYYREQNLEEYMSDDCMKDRLQARATKEWGQLAGEPIRCEVIGGTLYAFGSELAMLRLEHKMQCGRAKYSENLSTWTYCADR